MGSRAGAGGGGRGGGKADKADKPGEGGTKAERRAAAAARGPKPGLLDRATRLVLALFALTLAAQHTLPGVG